MRQFVIHSLAATAGGALLAFPIAPAFAKTVAECNTEYAANKAAIRAAKQTKKDFVAACRSGTETIPATAAAPTAPAGYQQPPAPAPPPFAPSYRVGATGAGQFATDAQARATPSPKQGSWLQYFWFVQRCFALDDEGVSNENADSIRCDL